VKPGYKTTEFYTTVTTALGLLVSALTNGLNDQTAAKYTGIVAAGYAISRGLAKIFPPKPTV
jgi:hypothetical protein